MSYARDKLLNAETELRVLLTCIFPAYWMTTSLI
jgi:hypothetical protein